MSDTLLQLNNSLLAKYLEGYYDTDGGCVERKTKGSHSIESNSTSKLFSEKLKLVLLRYGIIAKIRERPPTQNEKIKGRYNKYSLHIRGKENLQKFRDAIGFNHPKKREKLIRIIEKITKGGTNFDIVPQARTILGKIEKDLHLKILKRRDKSGISRNYLIKILTKLEKYQHPEIEKLRQMVHGDLLWEKIIEIQEIKNHGYEYVYDLTVEDSHNFIVNGILIHNTATVVRDEFMRGWSLEAGAMVLSNKGVLCIDELEKMDPNERSAMHESLEQQSVTISKANIHATLRAETSVLAAANPKLGRFDPYQPIAQQIDIPPTLLNRFDVIFTLRDLPDRAKDEAIATHVLTEHQQTSTKNVLDRFLLRKYFSYARQRIKPKLTEEAVEEIKRFYVELRNSPSTGGEEIKPIPISARQLEALVRLSEASAKTRLSEKVTKDDAKIAINLVKYYMMQVGYDYETKTFDIDKIVTGVTTSQRGKIITVREILAKLESKLGKLIPIEELKKELHSKLTEKDLEEALDKLALSGDIFYPRKGYVQRV